MPTYSPPRSSTNGLSSSILDNKLVQYGKIANRVSIRNADPQANIVDLKRKTANNSSSLLPNNAYNRFSPIRPTVISALIIKG